jgi:hypothetical protein
MRIHQTTSLHLVHGLYTTFTGFAACTFQALTGGPAVVSSFGRELNFGDHANPCGHRLTVATVKMANHIASNTEAKQRLAQIRGVDDAQNVSVVPMGVDEATFHPSARGQRGALGGSWAGESMTSLSAQCFHRCCRISNLTYLCTARFQFSKVERMLD